MPTHVNEAKLSHLAFLNLQAGVRHHTHDEEMRQYELLRAGDPEAVEESVRVLSSDLPGHVSDDPVRNMKYLFVASITLACRFAIEGGMDAEDAYNASDLYILRMDRLRTVDEVKALHRDMFEFYTAKMAGIRKEGVFSKPVVLAQDHLRQNLDRHVSVAELAAAAGLNPSYLSTLFRRETGLTITEYVAVERVETAKNMLRFTDRAVAEVAAALGFSSPAHLSRTFKRLTGMTPTEWRRRHFRDSEIGRRARP